MVLLLRDGDMIGWPYEVAALFVEFTELAGCFWFSDDCFSSC